MKILQGYQWILQGLQSIALCLTRCSGVAWPRQINPNILLLQTKWFTETKKLFDISYICALLSLKLRKFAHFVLDCISFLSKSRKYFMILIKIIEPFLFPWGLKWNSIAFHQIWKWNIKLSIATISLLQTQFVEKQSFVKQYSMITVFR